MSLDRDHHSQESSAAETEPDRATWEFWPNAPPGDFARLIPISSDARAGFQAVIERMLAAPQQDPWLYSSSFIHWELSGLDGQNSYVQSTPETGSSSDSEHHRPHDAEQSRPSTPIYTGYFRLNMNHMHPRSTVWVIGAGRNDKTVEFIITTPARKTSDGVYGRHAKLRRSLDSGVVIVSTDKYPISVDGHLLARRRDVNEDLSAYQRVAGSKSMITLGRMTYQLQMQDLRPSTDRIEIDAARINAGLASSGPEFFLTPTPNISAYEFGDYRVFSAFAFGSVGTVHYVTHNVTGRAYAMKRMKRGPKEDSSARNEITLLGTIKHPYIVRIVDVLHQRFNRPDIRQPDGIHEVCLILDPPGRYSLQDFVWPHAFDGDDGVSDTTIKREQFIQATLLQLAGAGAYLHANGIMHRDYKLENVAVVRGLPDVHVVLIDFGHAARAAESTDHLKGTVRYLAPEALALKRSPSKNNKPYNCLVDVWALGLITRELDLQCLVQNEDIARQWATELQQENPNMKRSIWRKLVPRMLQPDVGRRITMQQIIDELGQPSSSAGKRRAESSEQDFSQESKTFSRLIDLPFPPEWGS